MHTHTPENQRLVDLLGRVALKDQAAFRQLYDLTSAHLFGVALRFLRSRAAAEETLQDAYINVWQQAGTYASGLSTPMTWLMSIVRNKALDRLRKARAETELTGPLEACPDGQEEGAADHTAHADPHELFAAATETVAINRCMAQLEPAQRQSLALAFYNGLSHSELAAHLRVPLGTAKAWVRRGLDRLRKCLESDCQALAGRSR
jgi:RNA polymerase sigma-70 factor (ECF subfamily)